MSHRAPGEGCIVQRKDGRWQASIQLEGKRATVYGKTRSEVVAKLRALTAEAKRMGNRLPSATKLTLSEYLTEWLEQAEPRLRPKTFERYEGVIRLHVNPGLGSIPLAKLTPLRLSRHNAELAKKCGARTVQMTHRIVHRALADAAKWGLVASNVAGLVEAPKAEPKRRTLWTPEQLTRFATAVLEGEGKNHGYMLGFLLASGCRMGEAFGLTWPDVDFDAKSVHIDKPITFARHKPVKSAPKTRAGIRALVLPAWGIDVLRKQRARNAEWRLRAGERWHSTEHVLVT